MKNRLPFFLFLFGITTFLLQTGFQCGSTEVTSSKLYIKSQNWPKAEEALMKEVEKNPNNDEAWFLLGYYPQLNTGKYAEMNKSFAKSLGISNKFSDEISKAKLFVWGNSLKNGVDYHKLVQNEKTPKDSVKFYADKAVTEYNTAILVIPDSAAPYQNLASIYSLTDNYPEEIAAFKKLRDLTKDSKVNLDIINAWLTKAGKEKAANNTSAANQSYNEALVELTAARKTDPANQELLSIMIDLYLSLGRSKEAMPFIDEAVQKDPSNKVNQNNLGILQMEANDFANAATHFEAAMNIDPEYQDAIRNAGVDYLRWGQKMKEDAEAAAPIDPKTKEKKVDKTYVEKFKKSADLLVKLTKINPNDERVWNALATAYGNAGMFKEAQKALEEADKITKKK